MKKAILPLLIGLCFIGLAIWNCGLVIREWVCPKTLAQLQHSVGQVVNVREMVEIKPRGLLFSLSGENDKDFLYASSAYLYAKVKELLVPNAAVEVWYDVRQCAKTTAVANCQPQQIVIAKQQIVARDDYKKQHEKVNYLTFTFYFILGVIGLFLISFSIRKD